MKSVQIANIMEHAESNENGATFKKVVFHLHTPASFDYYPLGNNIHSEQVSINALNDYAIENELLTTDQMGQLHTLESRFEASVDGENFIVLDDQPKCFTAPGVDDCISEFPNLTLLLQYVLLASKLYQQGIDAVVVTDHQTVEGYSKLKAAFKILESMCGKKIEITLIPGIELSCADHLHVVGIFNLNEDNRARIKSWVYENVFPMSPEALNESPDMDVEEVQEWLKNNISNEETGTYRTSIEVLKWVNDLDGIGYIAHLNSANNFFGEKSYSMGYKKKLLELPFLKTYGFKENVSDSFKKKLRQISKKQFFQVREDDSHCLSEVAQRYCWVKCEKVNYQAIKSALINGASLLRNDIDCPSQPKIQIKSLFVQGLGFLGKKGQSLCISFSDRLNAFVGARGAGKSTILKIINFLLSQRCDRIEDLENILDQGTSCIHVVLGHVDYYVKFNGFDDSENKRDFIEEFREIKRQTINDEVDERRESEKKEIIKQRLQVYRGTLSGNGLSNTEAFRVLSQLYTRQFAISDLVKVAYDGEIGSFITTLLKDKGYIHRSKSKKIVNENAAIRVLDRLNRDIASHAKKVKPKIEEFNKNQENKIRLTYEAVLGKRSVDDYWDDLLDFDPTIPGYERSFAGFRITQRSVVDLLSLISEGEEYDYGFLTLLNLILHDDTSCLSRAHLSEFEMESSDYADKVSVKTNQERFIQALKKRILQRMFIVERVINEVLENVDTFGLEFNVNSAELSGRTNEEKYQPASQLSMGQTVTAMITLVLGWDEMVEETSPLILDQPEDNLDGRYIYNNMVGNLVKAKGERQVLIATHNSTLVINSGCEQVFVLESDGFHGWISQTGYSTKESILKSVVGIMEGGLTAFSQKLLNYVSVKEIGRRIRTMF